MTSHDVRSELLAQHVVAKEAFLAHDAALVSQSLTELELQTAVRCSDDPNRCRV